MQRLCDLVAFPEVRAAKAALDGRCKPTHAAKSQIHNLMSNQAKMLDNHRQLCPVMSGIGSGSQRHTGLGITAPLNVEYNSDHGNRWDTRPGRASICSAAQRWFGGIWFDPLGLRRELSPL